MQNFFRKLTVVFTDKDIRNRLLVIIGALALFRMLAAIPIPGVNRELLASFFDNNQFLNLIDMFSGGGLANLSIVMLGVGPFITASIIMQLMTVMSPRVKSLYSEEGEAGRAKFTQYSRLLTLPLAVLQGFGFLTLLKSNGVLFDMSSFEFIVNVVLVTAGSMLLMWIGELITEFGIGNGVSIIIFAGIVASLPSALTGFDSTELPMYLGFGAVALLIIYAVVIVTEAERPVPITYSKQSRGGVTYGGSSSYLPLRLNQAGVIPIIFALSILLFPQMLLNILSSLKIYTSWDLGWVDGANEAITNLMNNQLAYGASYFVLVFLFTYFYTAVTFDPEQVAKNLQQSGAYVPGIRPGANTAEYLGNLITRLTFVGALFLGAVAVLPVVLQYVTGNTSLIVGGTAVLIVVQVILDLIRRMDAQVSLRE